MILSYTGHSIAKGDLLVIGHFITTSFISQCMKFFMAGVSGMVRSWYPSVWNLVFGDSDYM